MILTDAELVLGLSRHLRMYQVGPERAALEKLEFAGQVIDVAFRLHGSTTSSAERVRAIGLDVGLNGSTLREVVATLEALGWLSVTRDASKQPVSIAETIPPTQEIIESAPRILNVAAASGEERAALAILRATSIQPLLLVDALEVGSLEAGGPTADVSAETALRHLTFVNLARRVEADDGREVVFNPNVWVQGPALAATTLRAADAHATREVGALLEEVANQPGIPETHVTSTELKWINFAVAQGLVQRSVIQTSDGSEKGFLFTPHLARDPFGGTAGDASGHVRQMVGSMIYAATFATYKLYSPTAFLQKLVRDGVAGNATSIGTDYPMLEKAGIVRVVPGSSSDRKRLELLQADVAEDAIRILSSRSDELDSRLDIAMIDGQRGYSHIEQERARLAGVLEIDVAEEARLIAALREQSSRRGAAE